MRLILDTNCYVSYLNKRNEEQHKRVSDILEEVSRAEHEVLFTGHNMTEIAYVLSSAYEMPSNRIHEILSALLSNPGIEFVHGAYASEILTLWPKEIKDYGDAVIAAAAKALDALVFTFDQSFSRSLKKMKLYADLS